MDQDVTERAAPHRLFHHFSELPYSMRVLFTAVLLLLGMGVLFGCSTLLHLRRTCGRQPPDAFLPRHRVAYSGSGQGSVLEAALAADVDHAAARREVQAADLGARRRDEAGLRWDQAGSSTALHGVPTAVRTRICEPLDFDNLKKGDGPRYRRVDRDAGAVSHIQSLGEPPSSSSVFSATPSPALCAAVG